MFSYFDIVDEMDRQRWATSHKWTTYQWDMYHFLRDRLQIMVMLDEEKNDIYEGEE